MNKKVIICILIILITISIIIGVFLFTGNKTIELTYKSNGGVPYKWVYKIEDESIVKFIKTKDITKKNNKNLVGTPSYTNYVFKGLKEGKTHITFKYVNIVDNKAIKEETVLIKVDKYKNISLIGNY